MINKTLLASALVTGLAVPAQATVYLPSKPAIIKRENMEFLKYLVLGMPMTMGILAQSAPPTFISGSATGNNQASGTPLSWSHTTSAVTDAIVVGTFINNNGGNAQVTSVTFNGVSFTQIQQSAGAAQGSGGLWILYNPPVGTYTLSVNGNNDRGIGGTAANFKNVKSVNVSASSANASTDPRTTTITSTATGYPIANIACGGSGATLLTFAASAPTGMALLGTARRFTSNSNAKYQGLFGSDTLVPAGSTSFTSNCTAGSLVNRNQQYAILT